MWIEIKVKEQKTLINSRRILTVCFSENGLWFLNTSNEKIHISTNSLQQAAALYEGFVLALNGLDFFCGDDYIKPIFAAKSETLHRHLMLKEVLADRSK